MNGGKGPYIDVLTDTIHVKKFTSSNRGVLIGVPSQIPYVELNGTIFGTYFQHI